jgi:urease accessory protein
MSHSHDHDHSHGQSHDHDHHSNGVSAAEHGHTHEILDGPGSYLNRELPIVEGRDFNERAFTIGIGGSVFLAYNASLLDFVCCEACYQSIHEPFKLPSTPVISLPTS